METLDLSPEFGSLNFEDIDDTSFTLQSEDSNYDTENDSKFKEEMEKVIKIMKIAGDEMPASTLRTLMTDLVMKAKEESHDREEIMKKVNMVGNLVTLFKESNAQRAIESFENRKPDSNPVQEQLEQVVENLLKEQSADDAKRDFSQILFEKAKKKPVRVPNFDDILETPRRPSNTKPRMHKKPTTKDFSQILFNKAKARPDTVRDFNSGLNVPVFFDHSIRRPTSSSAEDQQPTRDFSQILIEKAKSRPNKIRDFDISIDLPEFENSSTEQFDYPESFDDNYQEEFEEFTEFEESIHTSTPAYKPDLIDKAPKTMTLSEILKMPESKEMIEDHIMDMIIENPNKAAADLAGLFDIKTKAEQEATEKELNNMMETDPLAVTAAFTDLILAQKNAPNSTPVPVTIFEPHRIEDPPKAVEGQLLRMMAKPPREEDRVRIHLRPAEVEVTTPPPQQQEFHVAPTIESQPPFNDAKEVQRLEMSSQFLDTMIRLIEDGEMSHEQVIEEMINSGLLPVEVTEIGKIPIFVGKSGPNKGTVTRRPSQAQVARRPLAPPPQRHQPVRNQPLRQKPFRQLPVFSDQKAREVVTLARLQQLRIQAPQMVMRDNHDTMIEVNVNDPDGDFEMVRSQQPPPVAEEVTAEKDIEILSSMMDLYEQGMITDQELEQMVIMLEEEDLLDVNLKELGIEKDREVEETFKFHGDSRPFHRITQQAKDELQNPFRHGVNTQTPPPQAPGQDTRRHPSAYSHFSMGTDELQNPFRHSVNTHTPPPQAPEQDTRRPPSVYSHFSMGTSRPEEHQSTQRPPDMPPPSTESVHNVPFFMDLSLKNPFANPFEDDFELAKLGFNTAAGPGPTPAPPRRPPPLTRPSPQKESIKPGPAPPYYMSARLPAPPAFRYEMGRPTHAPEQFEEVPFLPVDEDEHNMPFRLRPIMQDEVTGDPYQTHYNLEHEMFAPAMRGEPFPPPSEFKREVLKPLPLILHSHEGNGYPHPHFDVPSELLSPEEFIRLPRKIPQNNRPVFETAEFDEAFRPSLPFPGGFQSRQGGLRPQIPLENVREKRKLPQPFQDSIGLTGFRDVDRRLDMIRQSYHKGDGMGSANQYGSRQ